MSTQNQLVYQVLRFLNINADILSIKEGTINIVVEFPDFVLRITPNSMRDQTRVATEIDFIRYVGNSVAEVVTPLAVKDSEFVVQFESAGRSYSLTKFSRAVGKMLKEVAITPELVERIGEIAAKIHTASVSYSHEKEPARHEWFSEKWIVNRLDILIDEPEISAAGEKLIERLKSLPKTKDTYGIVHADMNRSNFKISDTGELKLYDFDDSHQSWFGYDLAVTAENLSFHKYLTIEAVTQSYLAGYKKFNSVERLSINHFDDFFTLRCVSNYLFLKQLDPNFRGGDPAIKEALFAYRELVTQRLSIN